MSWCRAQFGTFDQRYFFLSFFFFLSYSLVLFGAPSLTRGRVWDLGLAYLTTDYWLEASLYPQGPATGQLD
jgi:hypothetical protein